MKNVAVFWQKIKISSFYQHAQVQILKDKKKQQKKQQRLTHFSSASKEKHVPIILTWLCRVQHQPANSDVTVPQTVEQLGDVVQDDLLPQETFLQQLLHLRPQTLHAGCVSSGLYTQSEHLGLIVYSLPLAAFWKRGNVTTQQTRIIQMIHICSSEEGRLLCDHGCLFLDLKETHWTCGVSCRWESHWVVTLAASHHLQKAGMWRFLVIINVFLIHFWQDTSKCYCLHMQLLQHSKQIHIFPLLKFRFSLDRD